MIAIIDYGRGNLRSVQKGFEKVGVSATITQDPKVAAKAAGVVLPGVGAFADAMTNLKDKGLDEVVREAISLNKPFLGICLGLQLLFETSEEWGYSEGLGIFPGRVRQLPDNLKVPHMGWNQVDCVKLNPLIEEIANKTYFYFVHSFYVEPADKTLVSGLTEYGLNFTSMISKNNLFALQFHPEKSSTMGLQILKNFGRIVANVNNSGC
ncbi:imidazole glycerol phosphate synthase [Peptococcaceae bacterium SCADC1_2_3]|nr:imidazole glycerol phosphate synthase [Peptococcaceae bacterium SCADC1_2_3]